MILHLDLDAFFASVEALKNPALRGRPVIVGAGVIASCSYEARRFGLHAGMSLGEARRRCPQAVILAGDHHVYRCFAEEVWRIVREESAVVETGLDEAYADLAGEERLHPDPAALGESLRARVRAETGLAASVGVGPNRMLARLASRAAKPDGLVLVPASGAEAFLAGRPVDDLPGVGRKVAQVLGLLNVATVEDLRRLELGHLQALFGRAAGLLLYERCRGRDPAPVRGRRAPASISRATSFAAPEGDRGQVEALLSYLTGRAARRLRELKLAAGGLRVELRYADFDARAAARLLAPPADGDAALFASGRALLRALDERRRVALRFVGLTLEGLRPAPAARARSLLPGAAEAREPGLLRALDALRGKYGHGVVVAGEAIRLMGKLERHSHGFVLRTPSLAR